MSRFRVRFNLEAEEDLLRLFDFLLEQDISAAERAEAAIAKAIEVLKVFPFSCRKAIGGSPRSASPSRPPRRLDTEAFSGPQADDIAGMQFIYGPAAQVPEPGSLALLGFGLLAASGHDGGASSADERGIYVADRPQRFVARELAQPQIDWLRKLASRR